MREIRLALTGFGNVGQGVAELLSEHGADYEGAYGLRLALVGVADRGGALTSDQALDPLAVVRAKRAGTTVAAASGGEPGLAGRDFLRAAAADLLLETASTNFENAEPGWSYARDAIDLGMDVILASKGALVLHFEELMNRARSRDRAVMYAGTTGAPLPVREVAESVLAGDRVEAFEGIVNVTANVVLAAMGSGASYDEGVVEAQRAGLAETDPTLDVDGWDAAAKAMIVARTVFGADLSLDDVRREGIRGVTPEQIRVARQEGRALKLIAGVARDGTGVRAWVGPETRPLSDPLGRLEPAAVGMIFHTHILGAVTATVRDTGPVPTALSVLRDVFNLARARGWMSQS